MSSDSKNPFGDVTRVPTPGARGRADARSAATVVPGAPPSRPAEAPSRAQPEQPRESFSDADGSAPGVREFSAGGTNRLLSAAMPLIALIGRLRGSMRMPNVARVRQEALATVRRFDEDVAQLGYPPDLISGTRYVLCSAIDQAVLSTPWGLSSEWATQGLLNTLFRQSLGGEFFFETLERTCADPKRNIDLLEVQYVCLSLGFGGKFQDRTDGSVRLSEYRERAYRLIRDVRGPAEVSLSLKWEGERDRRNRLLRFVPLWVAAVVAATLILGSYLFYAWMLGRTADPVLASLAQLGATVPDYRHPGTRVNVHTLTLRELLKDEQAAHVLTVEDTDKGAMVSLTAADLFASGSDTPNPQYADVILKVADALNQLPGRVLVIGHTDDQPIHSLRFASNVELSLARAISVKNVLLMHLKEPTRVNWQGLGPTAPKCVPADRPDSRACNRRVEIVLQS
jgi:type VI secretion system protein ImpK